MMRPPFDPNMAPIEAYIQGLRDGADFCTATLRISLIGESKESKLVEKCLNQAADILDRNMKEVIKEWRERPEK